MSTDTTTATTATTATGATSGATATEAATTTRTASRLPNPLKLVPALGPVGAALYKAVSNESIPQRTIDLLQLRAGQIAGSTYLTTMHTNSLRGTGETEERITAVATWQDADCFTPEERVALALTDAVLRPNAHGERVPDQLYAQAADLYDPTALTTLALAIGQVNFYTALAVIGKPLPGRKPSEQWT